MRGHLPAPIVAIVMLCGGPAASDAQAPTLAQVLNNAAGYLAAFQKQLAGIAAEETYTQEVLKQRGAPSPYQGHLAAALPRRTLRSDLLLVKPAGSDRYVEFRDVFEVDGVAVRDRDERLARLLGDASPGSFDRMREIIEQSARFNIGEIRRNVNTPVLALTFLAADRQHRFEFKRARRGREQVNPTAAMPSRDAAANPGVFRVATEMWAIEYRERDRPTLIRTPDGKALPARGRFWINPATGAVLISELVIDGGGVEATITVSYQSEPLVGFLVPVAMHESYKGHGEHVVGTASYGRFRQISVPSR